MDSKLRAKVLTMAAATLGLSLIGACGKKAEPAAAEGAAESTGGETSCGGANSCGANKPAEGEAAAPAEGEAAPAEGDATAPAPAPK
jgi:hypothetical protein